MYTLQRSEKTILLDRIQDITVSQGIFLSAREYCGCNAHLTVHTQPHIAGCMEKCWGLDTLTIETAGM
jgi:hypothetical protein